MLDTTSLNMGARLKVVSTQELVDYLLVDAGDVVVIREDGSLQGYLPTDLELVGLA